VSLSPGDVAAAQAYAAGQSGGQGFTSQTAEFFLSNYRLVKTLGIGSFGKVGWDAGQPRRAGQPAPPLPPPACSPPAAALPTHARARRRRRRRSKLRSTF
jgi:hypothetical protein